MLPVATASADISAKIVVPKPRMRRTSGSFSGTTTSVGDVANVEQKGANLRAGDRVLLQTGRLDWQGGIDVVVEGRAALAVDETLLRQLAGSFRARWDGRWAYELRDGSLHHSAGFPVLTYSVRPDEVLAFAQGTFGQTVHRFPPG